MEKKNWSIIQQLKYSRSFEYCHQPYHSHTKQAILVFGGKHDGRSRICLALHCALGLFPPRVGLQLSVCWRSVYVAGAVSMTAAVGVVPRALKSLQVLLQGAIRNKIFKKNILDSIVFTDRIWHRILCNSTETFNIRKFFHTDALSHGSFDTKTLFYTTAFTQTLSSTNAFTHRELLQSIVHTDGRTLLYAEGFTHTNTLLHLVTFTQRSICTQVLLLIEVFSIF